MLRTSEDGPANRVTTHLLKSDPGSTLAEAKLATLPRSGQLPLLSNARVSEQHGILTTHNSYRY